MDTDRNIPTTDEEVKAILNAIGSNETLTLALVGHYQCGRAMGKDVLTAYEATLVAFA